METQKQNNNSITKGDKMVNLSEKEMTELECNPETGAVAIPENWEDISLVEKVQVVLERQGLIVNHLREA